MNYLNLAGCSNEATGTRQSLRRAWVGQRINSQRSSETLQAAFAAKACEQAQSSGSLVQRVAFQKIAARSLTFRRAAPLQRPSLLGAPCVCWLRLART